MKYLVKFFVVTVFIIFSTQVFAEQKIVVLDMKYVLNNSKSGKNAQEFLKKQFNDNAKKLSELEKSLKKEEADLLDSKASLSKEEYKAKSDSLRKKVAEYQSERRSSLDKLAGKRNEVRKLLVDKIKPIIDSYIKENSISMVIDREGMIVGSKSFDITDAIIEKFDKEFPSIKLQ